MKDSNISNINIIRGMLPKEYLKKLCSLQKPKVGIIYQYLITFIPGGNKKLCMFKQTRSCWKLVEIFIAFYYNQTLIPPVSGSIGTSWNMAFAFRMIFIFCSEKIRRISKFPFSSFVLYFNLKLLFRYFFMLTHQRMLTYLNL